MSTQQNEAEGYEQFIERMATQEGVMGLTELKIVKRRAEISAERLRGIGEIASATCWETIAASTSNLISLMTKDERPAKP